MFFILRKENAQKAKRGLILGIVILPVIIGALFLLALGSDSFYDLESMSCDELQSEELAWSLEGTDEYAELTQIIQEKCE